MTAVLDRPATPAPAFTHSLPRQPGTLLEVATKLYEQRPDWITFFREVLGVDGIVRQRFQRPEDLAAFEATESYAEIQRMLAELRTQCLPEEGKEPTRVITVRLPKSLHESLLAQAHDRNTSMNQLAIAKLLQALEAE
jgi:predicted HicB family RNase H-like nuclease